MNISIITKQLTIIHKKDSFKGYLENIEVNSKTNGKFKTAAGLSFRLPIKGITNADGRVTSDNTQKYEILEDHI